MLSRLSPYADEVAAYGVTHNCCLLLAASCLAATPHRAAGAAEIAAVLADHRVVAALGAQRALHYLDAAALLLGDFEDAHFTGRVAVLVQYPEHGVAVHDQARDVGHGRGPVLLLAGTGHAGHEVAQRLGVVGQLPELHADPGRVEHAHVEREQTRQAVQGARVVAGEPHRVGPRDAVGQGDFLEAQHELFAGGRIHHIDGPRQRAVGAGLGFVAAEHAVDDGRGFGAFQRAELFAAVAHHLGQGRDHARDELPLAVGRQRQFEGVVVRRSRQGVELELEPGLVVGAHVHRQGLGHGADAARLFGAIDPDFEGHVAPLFVTDFADEEGELAVRRFDHVGPGGIAVGHARPAGPAQACQHRGGQGADRQAAVGVVDGDVLRLLLGVFRGGAAADREHAAQHRVGPVGGKPLEAGFPGHHVEVFELGIGVVGGDIHRLRDRGVDVGGDRGDHLFVRLGGDFQRGDEVLGQLGNVAALVLVQAPGVVLDRVFLEGAVGHALLARVGPGEGRFDAVRGVVGESQADGAGGRDRQEVRIAQAVLADAVLDLLRQARGEVAAGEVHVGVEQREGAALFRQFDRIQVGAVAHVLGDLGRHGARGIGVVAQLEHDQGVAEAGEAQADAALVLRFLELLLERPVRGVEHVVEHAHRTVDDAAEGGEIEAGALAEGVRDEQRQVDRAQAAAAVGRQRLFGAGVGGLDGFAVVKVVVLVHAVEEEDARLGVVVGGAHDLLPQVTGANLAIDPAAIAALVGAGGLDVGRGRGAVRQFDVAVGFHRLHEGIGDADRDVEVGQVAGILGVDEFFDVRMVAAQDAHLRAAAAAGGFDGLAGAVEDAHVGDGAGSARLGALDVGADRTDRGEVIADAAAAAHGFGGLQQRGVNAGAAVDDFRDRIAYRLHEAVDQRRAQIGAGGRVDAAGGNEAVFLGFEEARLPKGALVFGFDRSQRAGNAGAHVAHVALGSLGVLFDQHFP